MDQLVSYEEDPQLSSIAELTPLSKKWTIRAMLLETSCVRSSKKNGKQYKRFIFVDVEGTKLQACAFESDISKMDACFKLFETYEIYAESGNHAKNTLPNYNPSVQLILNQRPSIRPLKENTINKLVGKPPFVKLSKLENSLRTDEFIDVVAVLLDVALPRNKPVSKQHTSTEKEAYKLQEIILITEE